MRSALFCELLLFFFGGGDHFEQNGRRLWKGFFFQVLEYTKEIPGYLSNGILELPGII